jgi:hypothetical protein
MATVEGAQGGCAPGREVRNCRSCAPTAEVRNASPIPPATAYCAPVRVRTTSAQAVPFGLTPFGALRTPLAIKTETTFRDVDDRRAATVLEECRARPPHGLTAPRSSP